MKRTVNRNTVSCSMRVEAFEDTIECSIEIGPSPDFRLGGGADCRALE